MGFWSGLGKLALKAAPYVAAPFTGGASMALAPMMGGIANKMGNKQPGLIGGSGSYRTPPFIPEGVMMDDPRSGGIGGMMNKGEGNPFSRFFRHIMGSGSDVRPGTGPLNNEAYKRQSPGIAGRMGGMMRNLQNPHPHLAGPLMAGMMAGRQNLPMPPNTTMPIGPRTPLAGIM